MNAADSATPTKPKVKWRGVALPAEHGGWGFLLEPIALGLLVAPSPAGVFLGVASTSIFLLRNPLKIVLTDRRRGRRYARTAMAERFALLYFALAGGAFGAAVLTGNLEALLPLLPALPFGALQIVYDARNRGRALLPEIAAPIALASFAAAIALVSGWEADRALALWAILVARALPSVLYVRARLRLEHGQQPRIAPVLLAHVAAFFAVQLLAFAGSGTYLAGVVILVLWLRAAQGLSQHRRPVPAKVIGFRELGFGVMTVALVALGYALEI